MGYNNIVIALALSPFYVLITCDTKINPLSDEFIDFINANQSSWRAGRNFPRDMPLEFISSLMGTLKDDGDDNDLVDYEPDPDIVIPLTFDARKEWKNCPSLNDIRDQGSCGGCWAVAAASCMTDRYCIITNKNFYFSAMDVLTCCESCGFGCNSGKLIKAWVYYKDVGIVSGGPYGSHQGCRPYEIEPCDHHSNDLFVKCGEKIKTPHCKTECEKTYSVDYYKDRKLGTVIYSLTTIKSAQANIIKHGPITSTMTVFSDFINYKSGVYEHIDGAGQDEGLHSVKIIGWGEEGGMLYWLVANSWNSDWGDHGFFKIKRGVDHCGIEGNMVAGK